MDKDAEDWAAVRTVLRLEAGEAAFEAWLGRLTLTGRDETSVRLGAHSRFAADVVRERYGDLLRQLWRARDSKISRIDVSQAAAERPAPAPAAADRPAPVAPERPTAAARPAPSQSASVVAEDAASDAVWTTLEERYTFDSFVVGKSNELAHAAAQRAASSDSPPFNPLFLYGGVGLGKTHLMHAIAHEARLVKPGRKVLYLSAEKFMYQFVSALRYKDTISFKQTFRNVDMLLVDDVQFISGKDSTQEEFFHTFNALIDDNKQIVLSADRSPSDIEGLEDRIRSRLGWGLVADIHPTDYELRLGVLQGKADEAARLHPGLSFSPKVLEFVAHRINSNVRELEGAFTRLVAHATLVGRPITLDMTQDILQDLLRACDRKVTIEEIQRRVADHYAIRIADMHSPRRARQVVRPRQVAMYLCKQLTTRSLPEIGRKFGGRDHTTVMHAVKKVEELRETDSNLNDEIEILRRMLEA